MKLHKDELCGGNKIQITHIILIDVLNEFKPWERNFKP